jgi:hypothetical protein
VNEPVAAARRLVGSEPLGAAHEAAAPARRSSFACLIDAIAIDAKWAEARLRSPAASQRPGFEPDGEATLTPASWSVACGDGAIAASPSADRPDAGACGTALSGVRADAALAASVRSLATVLLPRLERVEAASQWTIEGDGFGTIDTRVAVAANGLGFEVDLIGPKAVVARLGPARDLLHGTLERATGRAVALRLVEADR